MKRLKVHWSTNLSLMPPLALVHTLCVADMYSCTVYIHSVPKTRTYGPLRTMIASIDTN